MGIRVGRRLAIAGLLFGLAACNAAADPLDELAVGERGRVVRVVDGDALALDTGQSVRLVGVEAPPHRTATGRRGWLPRSSRALRGSALILEIGKSAAELCQAPEGTAHRALGFLRDGRLEVSHPLNLEKLD
ncbi:MAG: hypothetical protein GC196_04490 [Hyphomonas sp.]|nr:hypothetical protein [Hyphomonas sp.]